METREESIWWMYVDNETVPCLGTLLGEETLMALETETYYALQEQLVAEWLIE